MGNQIIGIDIADEKFKDCTAISSICTSCNTIIESKAFSNSDNQPQMTIFRRCPNCNLVFKNILLGNKTKILL